MVCFLENQCRVPSQTDMNCWILEWLTCKDPLMEPKFSVQLCGRYGSRAKTLMVKICIDAQTIAQCFDRKL